MADKIFLQRSSYRHRRMMDAVRLLPVLGFMLWMVPLLWPLPEGGEGGMPMRQALWYLFGVWVLLGLAGWALWRRTGTVQNDPSKEEAPEAEPR